MPPINQLFTGLAKATGSEKLLAGEPGGVFRRQKDSDGGDVARLADAAERSLGDGGLLEINPIMPPLWVPSVSTTPGLMVLTRIFFGPSSRESTPVMASTAPLVPE